MQQCHPAIYLEEGVTQCGITDECYRYTRVGQLVIEHMQVPTCMLETHHSYYLHKYLKCVRSLPALLTQVVWLPTQVQVTSFGHLATLEASRGGGNIARGIYCSWDILAREHARFARSSTLLILRALCLLSEL